MRVLARFLIVGVFLSARCAFGADDNGRYQMIPLPKSENEMSSSVMILDTKEGNIWQWVSQPKVGQIPGGYYLRYQGKLKPGKEMGELIDKKQF